MATDVNTRLQNISTDVSAISNLVNRLVTIYSAGGVQNPDLATLKGELQAYVDTKDAQNVKLSGDEDIAGIKKFTGNLRLKKPTTGYLEMASNLMTDYSPSSLSSDAIVGIRACLSDYSEYYGYLNFRHNSSNNVKSAILNIYDKKGTSEKSSSLTIYVDANNDNNCYAYLNTRLIVGSILPMGNKENSLGSENKQWSEVWVDGGVVKGSDERIKTEISDIPEAVLRAWGKVKFQQYKMKDAVAKKGNSARLHTGLIANNLPLSIQQAFASEGLDARDYGLFCYDEWEDQYEDVEVLVKPEVRGQVKVIDAQAMYNTVFKEDGTEEQVLVSPEKSHMEEQVIEEAVYKTERKLVQPKGNRYSLRYDECLCLECAYQRWRMEQLEARLGK